MPVCLGCLKDKEHGLAQENTWDICQTSTSITTQDQVTCWVTLRILQGCKHRFYLIWRVVILIYIFLQPHCHLWQHWTHSKREWSPQKLVNFRMLQERAKVNSSRTKTSKGQHFNNKYYKTREAFNSRVTSQFSELFSVRLLIKNSIEILRNFLFFLHVRKYRSIKEINFLICIIFNYSLWERKQD